VENIVGDNDTWFAGGTGALMEGTDCCFVGLGVSVGRDAEGSLVSSLGATFGFTTGLRAGSLGLNVGLLLNMGDGVSPPFGAIVVSNGGKFGGKRAVGCPGIKGVSMGNGTCCADGVEITKGEAVFLSEVDAALPGRSGVSNSNGGLDIPGARLPGTTGICGVGNDVGDEPRVWGLMEGTDETSFGRRLNGVVAMTGFSLDAVLWEVSSVGSSENAKPVGGTNVVGFGDLESSIREGAHVGSNNSGSYSRSGPMFSLRFLYAS
jgi:hypothetical protein